MKGQYVVTGEVYDELGDEYIIIFTFNQYYLSLNWSYIPVYMYDKLAVCKWYNSHVQYD